MAGTCYSYGFSSSGSGKWKNDGKIPELNLSDEGEKSSVQVTIKDEAGNEYTANLSNHSDENGNNKNSKNGTDNYNISGVTKKEQPKEQPKEEPRKVEKELTIEEELVPMSELPEEAAQTLEPTVEETAAEPVVEEPAEIAEEEVPLADVPKTGDVSALWLALTALSGSGLTGLGILGKKRGERNAE